MNIPTFGELSAELARHGRLFTRHSRVYLTVFVVLLFPMGAGLQLMRAASGRSLVGAVALVASAAFLFALPGLLVIALLWRGAKIQRGRPGDAGHHYRRGS